MKTLRSCFNEKIDTETSNIVDTVEDRIQNATLTAVDNIVAPKIELAIRSVYASSISHNAQNSTRIDRSHEN